MSALILIVQAALCAYVGWAEQRQHPTALTGSAWLRHLNIPQPSHIHFVHFLSGSTAFFLLWGIITAALPHFKEGSRCQILMKAHFYLTQNSYQNPLFLSSHTSTTHASWHQCVRELLPVR